MALGRRASELGAELGGIGGAQGIKNEARRKKHHSSGKANLGLDMASLTVRF